MKKVVLAIAMVVWVLALNSCVKEDVAQTEKEINSIKNEIKVQTNAIDKGTPPPPNG